jgi:acyl transferase domain-containing protein
VRLAVTAQSVDELNRKLGMLRSALESQVPRDFLAQAGIFLAGPESPLRGAPVAITFPGQGGQYPNMLRELAADHPVVRQTLDEGDAAYRALCGRALTDSFFTDDPGHYRQRDEDIHAAVLLANVALYRLLVSLGFDPDVLIGQSAGELAALVAAESLSLADGLAAIRARTLAVLNLPLKDPGQMAALSCAAEEVPSLLAGLPGYATLAADNGPRACIVSADSVALSALVARCRERNLECSVLAVSHGYHSQLIAAARRPYEEALRALRFQPPRKEIVSTIDARPYAGRSLGTLPAFLASQFVEPVRLRAALREAHAHGARVFLEAGPKWSLTQFTRESLRDVPHGAMASTHPKVGEREQLQRLLGFCFVHQVGAYRQPFQGVSMLKHTPSPQPPSPAARPLDAERALMELPLGGVLSPESVRRVASALGARFGVDATGARPEDLTTFDAVVHWVERRVGAGRQAAPVQGQDAASVEAEVQRVLLGHAVTKTGYPEDMLGLDLDLEADLGIDTVKQVDIFAKTREHFGLERDPNLALRDFNTLRKVVVHLRDRILTGGARAGSGGGSTALTANGSYPSAPIYPSASVQPSAPIHTGAPGDPSASVASVHPERRPQPAVEGPPVSFTPPSPAPPNGAHRHTDAVPLPSATPSTHLEAEVHRVLLGHAVAKTGYPEDMLGLDLDLEADLGIDTVKQVDIFAKTREHFGLERDPNLALRDFNTLRKVIAHIAERARQAPSRAAPAAQPTPSALSAAPFSPPPSAPPSHGAMGDGAGGNGHSGGAQSSQPGSRVQQTLMSMRLTQELGLSEQEKHALVEALANRLGRSPAAISIDTLEGLIRAFGGAGTKP